MLDGTTRLPSRSQGRRGILRVLVTPLFIGLGRMASNKRPLFITLDGIDGGGKSTQIELLTNWLQQQGHSVQTFRDPGTTKLGTAVREILLHREDIPLANTTEMLLYMAARAQLVAELVQPALEQGHTVLCDRFLLANVVYQGYAGGLTVDAIWEVGKIGRAHV